jgi:uncharacterized protein YegP (UPF0339 family)
MWTLVLIASIGLNSMAITTVPGYTSKANCLTAAEQAKAAPTNIVTVRVFCVEVK